VGRRGRWARWRWTRRQVVNNIVVNQHRQSTMEDNAVGNSREQAPLGNTSGDGENVRPCMGEMERWASFSVRWQASLF